MIIGIEGLSTSGKTTLINKLIEKYPEIIRFRGAGAVNVGMQTRWQEYNFWMHNIIEQLDKLNNHKNIILWDRFLTDAVHSEDQLYRSEILRVMKSHTKKCVVYINVDQKELIKRNTKEGDELNTHAHRYKQVLKSFNTLTLYPREEDKYYITDAHIDEVYSFIKNQMK